MAKSIPERDWKFMKRIKDELLATLCDRINKQAASILSEQGCSEHEKYINLYKHVETSDHLVATCFKLLFPKFKKTVVHPKVTFSFWL